MGSVAPAPGTAWREIYSTRYLEEKRLKEERLRELRERANRNRKCDVAVRPRRMQCEMKAPRRREKECEMLPPRRREKECDVACGERAPRPPPFPTDSSLL